MQTQFGNIHQRYNNICCHSMGTQYTNYLKKQRLGQINRLAVLLRTPTWKNAPTAALEIIHDIIPLELALQETAINAYHRLKLMKQVSWINNKVKNRCLIPHLKFLKTADAQTTGLRQDTETIIKESKIIITGSRYTTKKKKQSQYLNN